MKIRVSIKSEVLGNSIFWEGPPEKAIEIRNLAALAAAWEAYHKGKAGKYGMWRAEIIKDSLQVKSEEEMK